MRRTVQTARRHSEVFRDLKSVANEHSMLSDALVTTLCSRRCVLFCWTRRRRSRQLSGAFFSSICFRHWRPMSTTQSRS